MKKTIVVLIILAVTTSCMLDTGLVYMDTQPDNATLYLNGRKMGSTPITFEFTHDKPTVMEIKKDGFYPIYEVLDENWLYLEYRRGRYAEQHNIVIRGKARRRGWKVETRRHLKVME